MKATTIDKYVYKALESIRQKHYADWTERIDDCVKESRKIIKTFRDHPAEIVHVVGSKVFESEFDTSQGDSLTDFLESMLVEYMLESLNY